MILFVAVQCSLKCVILEESVICPSLEELDHDVDDVVCVESKN